MTDFNDEFDFDAIIAAHDKASGGLVVQRSQFCWDAGIAILPRPVDFEMPLYTIKFAMLADLKIKRLQAAFPSLEWLAYLVGEVNHESCTVQVNDLVIPKQTVTSVSVYNVEYDWNEGLPIIGVIHSHHRMGAFFSGTDDAYINQNHDVSIVVATAKGREIKSQVRMKVEGGYIINENMAYETSYPEAAAMKEFEETVRFQIGTPTYNYSPVSTGYTGRVIQGNFGGNVYRGYQNESANGYGSYASTGAGRFGSPARTSQYIPSAGDLFATADDSWVANDDPYAELDGLKPVEDMTEQEICRELALYYSADDIDEFLENDEIEDELEVIREMVRQGVIPKPHVEAPVDAEENVFVMELDEADSAFAGFDAWTAEDETPGIEEESRVDDLITKYATYN